VRKYGIDRVINRKVIVEWFAEYERNTLSVMCDRERERE
jgi:hypothetical protein